VPIKRAVVIHCTRPYTAQKVSGGCVTAISGSASKFAEDTCYEELFLTAFFPHTGLGPKSWRVEFA
jgi:hypothetical protein